MHRQNIFNRSSQLEFKIYRKQPTMNENQQKTTAKLESQKSQIMNNLIEAIKLN